MNTAAYEDVKAQLLEAALAHVPFDGWSETTFKAAIAETGTNPALARSACPRGAVTLALAFHHAGDAAMLARIDDTDLSTLKFREKIAAAVRFRLEAVDNKDLVRRGATLFALPQYAGDGAKAIWGTCDKIWTALGDTSDDVNWYSKRATLAGVYSATVLFWLGDDSFEHQDTWAFLDRRIENVMQIEKIKAQVNQNPVLKRVLAGPLWALSRIKAPASAPDPDLPGRWTTPH
jgi:ubiquinone biosynthesis protein COQ9